MDDESVRESFKRCEAAGDIGETSYGVFLRTSPQIAALFANTEFAKQRRHLRASVFLLVTRDIEDPKSREIVSHIGESHSRGNLDIHPELYDIWLQSLSETFKQMDPEWTEELDSRWRKQVQSGIDLITSLY